MSAARRFDEFSTFIFERAQRRAGFATTMRGTTRCVEVEAPVASQLHE